MVLVQSQSKLAEWFVKYDRFIFPIGAALLARIFISLIGIFTVTTTAIQHPLAFYHGALTPLEPAGLNILAAPFQRWDVVWYNSIATRGYAVTDQSAAFFPLLPLLMRILSFGTGTTLRLRMVCSWTICQWQEPGGAPS